MQRATPLPAMMPPQLPHPPLPLPNPLRASGRNRRRKPPPQRQKGSWRGKSMRRPTTHWPPRACPNTPSTSKKQRPERRIGSSWAPWPCPVTPRWIKPFMRTRCVFVRSLPPSLPHPPPPLPPFPPRLHTVYFSLFPPAWITKGTSHLTPPFFPPYSPSPPSPQPNLVKGAFKLHPKLVGKEKAGFTYGYNLKKFPDEPIKVPTYLPPSPPPSLPISIRCLPPISLSARHASPASLPPCFPSSLLSTGASNPTIG